MGFLVFLGLVIAIIVIVMKVDKNIKDTAKWKAENEEWKRITAGLGDINERFRKAAETGADPKDVLGFMEVEIREENSELKNCSLYTILKFMCIALARRGYLFDNWGASCFFHKFNGATLSEVTISVLSKDGDKLGDISFWGTYSNAYFTPWSYGCWQAYFDRRLSYSILLYPYFDIRSNEPAPLGTSPKIPEWLEICADVIKMARFDDPPPREPELLDRYPDARRYVNAMFH